MRINKNIFNKMESDVSARIRAILFDRQSKANNHELTNTVKLSLVKHGSMVNDTAIRNSKIKAIKVNP